MDRNEDIIRSAQLGDSAARERLAEIATERLRIFARRLTSDEHLRQDVVQESVLRMLRFLDGLEDIGRFRPWLFRIAINEFHRLAVRENKHHGVECGVDDYEAGNRMEASAVEEAIASELRASVSRAMLGLKAQHRTVLVLRCYENMDYSQIAESMGCSKFGARKRFSRAKRALAKRLAKEGLGKGSQFLAIVLFGKMMSETQAAVAGVTVTAATLKVGVAAVVAGTMLTKAALVTVAVVGAIGVGTVVVTQQPRQVRGITMERVAVESTSSGEAVTKGEDEVWYYYPLGAEGPVMMRGMRAEGAGRPMRCVWGQSEVGYYRLDERSGTVHIENYNPYNSDLSVRRLPTDGRRFREFLLRMDGRSYGTEVVKDAGPGLLVISRNCDGADRTIQTTHERWLLEEEHYRNGLPKGSEVTDNRDAMHKRGWAYFKISGRINGEPVSGEGRMAFLPSAWAQERPWIRIRVGGKSIVDTSFAGLGRPWLGLHTVDVVRRDAAGAGLAFETSYSKQSGRAIVKIRMEEGDLVYQIDMERDLIEQISISGERAGEIRFDYLEDIEGGSGRFVEPVSGDSDGVGVIRVLAGKGARR